MRGQYVRGRMFALRTTRLTLTVVGMLAVVMGAAVGTAMAVQEVCTTDGYNVGGAITACFVTNTYAYGPAKVVDAQLISPSGTVVTKIFSPIVIGALITTAILVTPPENELFICRVTVEELEPGTLRVYWISSSTGAPVGTAQCTPF